MVNGCVFALLLGISLSGACQHKRADGQPSAMDPSTEDQGESPPCLLVQQSIPPQSDPSIRVQVLAEGLEVPWGLAFLPDGGLLITERTGRLRRWDNGQLEPQPLATWDLQAQAEGGLLGIELDPNFAANSEFFIYVTHRESSKVSNRVERWRLVENGRRAQFVNVLLGDIPAAQFHDGGKMRIGPDGMLYIGTGDARKPDLAQDRKSLAGKLLRINPNGSIPSDNPWPNTLAFIVGIRNTQGFDWIDDKRLIVTDHGPSGELSRRGHDEVNVIEGGANLGWPTIYGCEARQGMVSPSLTWVHATPPGGATFYTGDAIPQWKGSLLIGVLGDKHLHRVVFDRRDPRRVVSHEAYFAGDPPDGYGRLRDVVQGPDGALYLTTSNCDGRGECPSYKDRILRLSL